MIAIAEVDGASARFGSTFIKLVTTVHRNLQTRVDARRRLLACQSLDPRFAKDIGLSPESLDWECSRAPWVRMSDATAVPDLLADGVHVPNGTL